MKSQSQFRLGINRLKRHRLAMTGLGLLGLLYFSAVFADFLAPYHYDNEARQNSYNPPSRIHIVDKSGRLRFPYIYRYRYEFDASYNRVWTEDKSKSYPIRFFVGGDEHRILGLFKTHLHLFGTGGPDCRIYLMGADSRGRDLFSRILYGARISLSIGIVGTLISFFIGMIIGGISGYIGGKIDNIIMRICEMIMMIPGFYLMLALRASFPPEISSIEVYFLIVFILSFIGWAGLARVIRGMAISLREREFVVASRALGLRSLSIIVRHILPNTLSYVIVALTLSIPGYILGESALSLLGLGIQDPHASWGNLLAEAMNIAQIRFHPWILIPGVFIFIAVMSFNLLGDGLRDAFDPMMK